MKPQPTYYKNLAGLTEDDRIRQIGRETISKQLTVAFITDDEVGKAERYIFKLQRWFPGIRVVGRGLGPVDGTVFVKVAPPLT